MALSRTVVEACNDPRMTYELLGRLAERGGMKAGLNPPDDIEDEELVDIVWRAVGKSGLADS